MEDITLSQLWNMVDKGGSILLALLFGLAFLRGWIVPRWAYDKMSTDCERMTQIAMRTTELSERATAAAERVVPPKVIQ